MQEHVVVEIIAPQHRGQRPAVSCPRKGLPTILQVPFRVAVTAMEVGVR